MFNDLKQSLSTAASRLTSCETMNAPQHMKYDPKILNLIQSPEFKVFKDPNSPSMHCKQQDDIMQNVEWSPAFET